MASKPDTSNDAWRRRERPWLIASNRKLRHLHAITLRNLNLDHVNTRPRRQTIDDEAVPTSLKSPAKILALREGKQLGHSRSQDNLRPIHENALDSASSNGDVEPPSPTTSSSSKGKTKTPPRPTFAKLRRRSTLEWATASSLQRQKKLEDVSASRMADVFFSLHISGLEGWKDPIYVSEVVEKAMNPNFNHIDLDACPPAITRLDVLTVKFWSKTERQTDYILLLDLTLSLRSLQFIGKSLASFHHPFPPNCLLFHLTDGFYTAFTDARVDEPPNPFLGLPIKENTRPLPTSSFDALLRLSKLDDSVQDALALRDRLATDLQDIVQSNNLTHPEKSHVNEAKDFVKTIEYATSTIQKQLKSLQHKRDEKRKALQTRRDLLAQEKEAQHTVVKNMKTEQEEMHNQREEREILRKSVAAQRRRISTDLVKIYPILPIPNRQLAFSIRNLHLPNSEELDSTRHVTPDTIAAALGHVAHVIQLLSFYWSIVLPYKPHPRSSTSSIFDPISILQSGTGSSASSSPFTAAAASMNLANDKALRTFPLFAKAAVRFRFEYGLFLLNKDIQLLLETGWGVRILDIRQTLPNLLLAVHCATAGEGELPARKAGGVRGLVKTGRERIEFERRDSDDSTTVIGSDVGADGDLGAFESLKRVGRRRDKRVDGYR